MVLLLVGLVAVDLLMALFTWRLELAFSAQARGQAEAWAAAGGLQVGPFTASAVAARGVSPRAELFAFGRRVHKLPKEEQDEEEDEAEDPALERAEASAAPGQRRARGGRPTLGAFRSRRVPPGGAQANSGSALRRGIWPIRSGT